MWRQNTFPGDTYSDQSISDEDDHNVDLRDNCVSISGRKDKEEGLQLQSRLDVLRGAHEVNYGQKYSSISTKKQTSVSCEDEVEVPDFPDEGCFVFSPRKASTCDTDDEEISDDEENVFLKFSITPGTKKFHKDRVHNFRDGKQNEVNSWTTIGKEAEALIHSNENAFSSPSCSAYSKANKSDKGIKSRSKPKFSFRFQSNKQGLSCPFSYKDKHVKPSKIHKVPEMLETVGFGEHSFPEVLEDFHGEKPYQLEIVPAEVEDLNPCDEDSVAELSDGLQDSTSLLRRSSKMYSKTRGKMVQNVLKGSTSPLVDRTIVSEDLPEPLGNGLSSEGEANSQNLKIAIPEMKRQTIADRFQEALGATSTDKAAFVAVSRPSGVGLFGKFQQVMQREKFKDMNFLKLQTRGSPNNEPSCIDVKILSRYLDAKLIVCHVSSWKNIEVIQWRESNQTMVNGGRERTIIFNARVCCDVDIEVGNLIRVHPPWKEIQVRDEDDSIILCTYFSQIST